jgi:hypothetical protein
MESALKWYDETERSTTGADRWLQDRTYRYALQQDGKLYPVKKLVAWATGREVSDFSQREGLRRHLEKLGFSISKLREDDAEEGAEDEAVEDRYADGVYVSYEKGSAGSGHLDDWLKAYPAKHEFTRQLALDYPRWMQQTHAEVHVVPLDNTGLSFRAGGKELHVCWFNPGKGFVYVRLFDLMSSDIELLRNKLSKPTQVKIWDSKPGRYGIPVYRFYVWTTGDYEVLKEVATRQVSRIMEAQPDEGADKTRGGEPHFWWVNQGATFAQEKAGGYIWAPKRDKRGGESRDWNNMTKVKTGDLVLHYSNGSLRAVGRVLSEAKDDMRPARLEGQEWEREGWRVEIEYFDLESPIPLAGVPQEIRRYVFGGPFSRNGGVNQGYLYPLSDQFVAGLTDVYGEQLPQPVRADFEASADASDTGSEATPGENIWLFQANAKLFDLAEEIKKMQVDDIDHWTVTSSYKRMKPGDQVVLWLAGPHGGVFGTGELVSEPYWHEFEPDEAPWVKPDKDGVKRIRRVDFRYTRIREEPIGRALLQDHPVLRGLEVFRFANATNFKVTEEQWNALLELMGEAPPVVTAVPDYEEPSFEVISARVSESGLVIDEQTLRRYHLSLKTRKFVILSGVSGTGKTWLTKVYSDAVGAVYRQVEVAPNWNTNEDLLGYLSPIDGKYHDTEFSLFLRSAAAEYARAEGTGKRSTPYHLVLDEMNLARVEYYFAKFLSLMEVRMREGVTTVEMGEEDVALTPNLFFIGTVNIDETTHGFADKVYDRAQLVEIVASRESLASKLEGEAFGDVLMQVWDAVQEVAPFAYRVIEEMKRYIEEAGTLGVSWQQALDEQILQKVLPKLKGADYRVEVALGRIESLGEEQYPLAVGKVRKMRYGYKENGFVSYF